MSVVEANGDSNDMYGFDSISDRVIQSLKKKYGFPDSAIQGNLVNSAWVQG